MRGVIDQQNCYMPLLGLYVQMHPRHVHVTTCITCTVHVLYMRIIPFTLATAHTQKNKTPHANVCTCIIFI